MKHSDLSIIVRGSEIFLSRSLSDSNITATEQTMLMYLYGHETPNQEEIAEYFMLDKGTVAKTLRKLEKKSLIERRVNEKDQREKVITLTGKAYNLKQVCVNLLKTWNTAIYKDISEAEREVFERVVGKIALNVVNELKK